jgi:hypothetical protein
MTEDPKRKKLRFKKTETSRLKTGAAAQQSAQEEEELSAAEEPEAAVPEQEGNVPEVTDPLALRDTHTSKVRRVPAGKESSPLATAVLPATPSAEKKTETVQLKVVQQKKKEIADMISPSSTVRLRAPGKAAPPQDAGAGTAGETVKVSPPEEGEKAMEGEAAGKRKTATQSMKKVGAEKPSEAEAPAVKKQTGAAATVQAEKPEAGEGGPGKTLKLRTGGKAGRTLKVSGAAAGQEEEAEGAKPAARADKTVAEAGAEPGVWFTVAAAVSLIAVGVLMYFAVNQYIAHIFVR